MALLRNITRGLGAIPREREPGLFNLPFRPPSIQQLPQGPQPIPQVPNPLPIQTPISNQTFNIGGPPLDTSLIPEREILQRPIIPPRRDDFMSIERIGNTDDMARLPGPPLQATPAPFVPPQQPTFTPISERTDIYGEGKRYDPSSLPEGFSFQDKSGMMRAAVMPPPGFVYAYGPDGEQITVPSGEAGVTPPGGTINPRFDPRALKPRGEPVGINVPGGGGIDYGPGMGGGLPDPRTNTNIQTRDTEFGPVTVSSPAAPTTDTINQGTNMATTQSQQPFASNILRSETGLDATTKQLLFGLDGKGGFIPGAMRAAERTFFDEQGNPIVIPEQVAGLSPDQLRAQELARMGVGIQDPYLQEAGQAYRGGIDALDQGLLGARMRGEQALDATRLGVEEEQLLRDRGLARTLGGLDRAEGIATGATDQFGRRLADVERLGAGAAGRFGTRLGGIESSAAGDVGAYGGALGESEALLRDTLGGYDPSMTQQFMDPYEQAVVDQTSKDIFEQFAKSDIGARASDIARGGQSAFGSRARLGAGERTEALGRGLAEALSGIRSRGFQQAQQTGLGEFARQQAARRAASSGLGSIAGSRLGAQRGLTDLMTSGAQQRLASEQGVVDLLGRTGQQQLGAQTGLGSTIAGYGTTAGSALGGAGQAALGSAGQLAGAFGNLSGLESQIGQQRQAARFGLGAGMQGLGSQAQGARAGDVSQLYGLGQGQQQLTQAQLDAARRNALTAQQAPLAQYQALAPFVSMAPAGQFQTQTTFAPSPSPLQAGLGVGLSTLGAVGNFMNQGQT